MDCRVINTTTYLLNGRGPDFQYIWTPLGYDRPERLYIRGLARLMPLICSFLRCLTVHNPQHFGVSPPEFDLS